VSHREGAEAATGGQPERAHAEPKAILEALLFAAAEPLDEPELQARLGDLGDARSLLGELEKDYAGRGVRLERREGRWAFRTAPELAPYLVRIARPTRRLSKAALETLAIIAYRQPVTRAEIEQVRGVTVAKGTFDVLVDAGLVSPKGRRDAPGRPVTWVTTPAFLDQFGLGSLADLPRLEELEGVGLFNPPGAD
jgi:segregation and condensation protein B